jgi:hypothetical protein
MGYLRTSRLKWTEKDMFLRHGPASPPKPVDREQARKQKKAQRQRRRKGRG